MELVATAGEMQLCDRTSITKFGIPSIVLMENAGRSVADVVEREFGSISGKQVYVLCGKGNNGGDGFVVARHLYNRGAKVKLFLMARGAQLSGDPKTNFRILLGIIREDSSSALQVVESADAPRLRRHPAPDIIVDALFGTGFSGAVRGEYEKAIRWMNESDAKVIAVDIPSGVNADNGRVENIAVAADATVTMGLRKIGLLVHPGRECSGSVHVVDIEIPKIVYQRSGIRTWYVQRTDVRRMLPRRPLDAHKHSVGKIFVLAGSRGLTGAAVMSCNSAMRAGAGAVVLGIPKSLLPIVSKKLTEVMPNPLEETEDQSVSRRAIPEINRFVSWSDLVVLGPGLGRNKETEEVILELIETIKNPLLIDADGLNALAIDPKIVKKRKAETILTPHTGELSRITKLPSDEIEENRVAVARSESKALNSYLVLKGAPTVVGTPSGDVFINSTGNPGMATAGAGDVLTGTIAALWGQHISAAEASVCGVYLHGLAGDLAKEKYGEMGLTATDIIEALPRAIMKTLSENNPRTA
jgi:NAD(P)H-hydrate epimerase